MVRDLGRPVREKGPRNGPHLRIPYSIGTPLKEQFSSVETVFQENFCVSGRLGKSFVKTVSFAYSLQLLIKAQRKSLPQA